LGHGSVWLTDYHRRLLWRTKPSTEQISGLIERVTFHNDQSGFCVLRVKVEGQGDEVTVVGSLPSVNQDIFAADHQMELGTKLGTIKEAKTRGKSRLSLAESLKFS
jgi:hypothetical protein